VTSKSVRPVHELFVGATWTWKWTMTRARGNGQQVNSYKVDPFIEN